jgi:hypothetical protein
MKSLVQETLDSSYYALTCVVCSVDERLSCRMIWLEVNGIYDEPR